MGMIDEIRWDAALPEDHPPEDRIFQTKSLHPSWEHYLVTREGRLLLVGHGWQDEDADRALNGTGVEVEFHGDCPARVAQRPARISGPFYAWDA